MHEIAFCVLHIIRMIFQFILRMVARMISIFDAGIAYIINSILLIIFVVFFVLPVTAWRKFSGYYFSKGGTPNSQTPLVTLGNIAIGNSPRKGHYQGENGESGHEGIYAMYLQMLNSTEQEVILQSEQSRIDKYTATTKTENIPFLSIENSKGQYGHGLASPELFMTTIRDPKIFSTDNSAASGMNVLGNRHDSGYFDSTLDSKPRKRKRDGNAAGGGCREGFQTVKSVTDLNHALHPGFDKL